MSEPSAQIEFLVFAKDPMTGKACPCFIVPANDAITARRLCEKSNIKVEAIEHYQAIEGLEKPRVCPLGPIDLVDRAEFTEYLVFAQERDTGKPWPLFIVPAPDKHTAHRLCQRRYLQINAIERYESEPGMEKPKVYPWGPPASDRKFERDYHNRPPEQETVSDAPSRFGPWTLGFIIAVVLFRVLILLLRQLN